MFARHGGDFTGIQDHFDYFNQLGVTALWLTPVIENNVTR
ncbi:MAG: alpha-amylase family glycosyl hydrolase [Bacteroidota bacterium]